jgi:hypothetical protein
MIYLFHGTDSAKTRAKAFQWIAASRAKAPEAMYLRLTPELLTEESLKNAMSAQGLFFTKTLVLIDDPFSESEPGELIWHRRDEMAASENPIALVTPKLTAPRLKKIEPHATKVFEQISTDRKAARGFNSSLVNALGAKDGAVLWKEIIKAERLGDVPEMVHGLLHWKARDIMQKGSAKWKQDEARALSRTLIEIVSDSRNGDLPLQLALERFALSLSDKY